MKNNWAYKAVYCHFSHFSMITLNFFGGKMKWNFRKFDICVLLLKIYSSLNVLLYHVFVRSLFVQYAFIMFSTLSVYSFVFAVHQLLMFTKHSSFTRHALTVRSASFLCIVIQNSEAKWLIFIARTNEKGTWMEGKLKLLNELNFWSLISYSFDKMNWNKN